MITSLCVSIREGRSLLLSEINNMLHVAYLRVAAILLKQLSFENLIIKVHTSFALLYELIQRVGLSLK